MKRTIAYRLCVVILVCMALIALISFYVQIKTAQENANTNFMIQINQIRQILAKNDREIEKLSENLKEDYLIRAKAAAYIIQNNPEIIGNQSELKKVSSLLQVDEFHLFDREGTLYAGTEPKYFGYSFHSGEQMRFFLPMLNDETLSLSQEMLPNTAEQKLMQYVAVWQEDRRGIVQIGMEPIRLLEALEKNELSHLFTMVTEDKDTTLFASSVNSGMILGSTNRSMIGRTIYELGINLKPGQRLENPEKWDILLDGQKSFCLLQSAGEVLIGVSIPYQSIYQSITYHMVLILLSLFVLSVAVVLLILRMLDHDIIQEMHHINRDLGKIAAGDLDYRIESNRLPEFSELGGNINHMVTSLLETTGKLSLIFQNVESPIAVYEYNCDMKRVLATSKIGAILGVPEEEMEKSLADQSVFIEKLRQILQHPCEEDVYQIGGENPHYVKIQSYQENHRTLGILVDVTKETVEKQQIKYERDVDLLTGLLTRRAFFDEMDRLFLHAKGLGSVALLMIDADHLKYVNDNWGHAVGDGLLACIAQMLKDCIPPERIAARLSGDEFVVFLYRMGSTDAIQAQIGLLHQRMLETRLEMPDKTGIPVRFSCGYAVFEAQGKDYREILKLADHTMYQAKKLRQGNFVQCDLTQEG